jgi:hypothetical protein
MVVFVSKHEIRLLFNVQVVVAAADLEGLKQLSTRSISMQVVVAAADLGEVERI